MHLVDNNLQHSAGRHGGPSWWLERHWPTFEEIQSAHGTISYLVGNN